LSEYTNEAKHYIANSALAAHVIYKRNFHNKYPIMF
jgi:hypothetical protein